MVIKSQFQVIDKYIGICILMEDKRVMMGTKRTSNSIGIKQYDFDFKKEKKIYSYLHGNKRKHKGLDDEYKFVDYSEWKKYIHGL